MFPFAGSSDRWPCPVSPFVPLSLWKYFWVPQNFWCTAATLFIVNLSDPYVSLHSRTAGGALQDQHSNSLSLSQDWRPSSRVENMYCCTWTHKGQSSCISLQDRKIIAFLFLVKKRCYTNNIWFDLMCLCVMCIVQRHNLGNLVILVFNIRKVFTIGRHWSFSLNSTYSKLFICNKQSIKFT